MNAEFELLVRSCGIARNLPVYGAVVQTQLPEGFNEAAFVNMAIQHKTAATAREGLKKLGITLNQENSLRLKCVAMQNRLIQSLIFEDAHTIVEAARARDIPMLIFKGLASSIELYGDPFIREYTDLDILVNLPDMEPLIPLMKEEGYEPEVFPPFPNTKRGGDRIFMKLRHVVFYKTGRPFGVEIHSRAGWENEFFRRDDLDAVFERAVTLRTSGSGLPAPDLPDHSLIILSHGVHHAWCLLHWLLDAAAILACEDTPLHDTIAARVRSLDLQGQLKLTCELVRKLYPIDLSPALESVTAGARGLDNAVKFAFTRLQSGGKDISSISNKLAYQFTYSFPLLRNSREKAASLLSLFKIPQLEMDALPLPRPLAFLYIPFRPFFILKRRIKGLREKRTRLHV
ncbi:MAG: nucleotidyltransferase family protein [Spirochaetes bacterium]|nr:nucleotidyltransferase family protein [Spirochaetota bacterium]